MRGEREKRKEKIKKVKKKEIPKGLKVFDKLAAVALDERNALHTDTAAGKSLAMDVDQLVGSGNIGVCLYVPESIYFFHDYPVSAWPKKREVFRCQ